MKITENNEAVFECKFNRDPKFENVKWFKDDEPLEEDGSRIKFVNDGKRQSLIIKPAKLSDTGNYSIKVRKVESNGWLKVRGIKIKL